MGYYAAANPFRFATKYTDIETGLVQYNTRYYSPSLGRFINRDSIEEDGGLNLYAYVLNNPVNGWDYLGMDPDDMVTADHGSGTISSGLIDEYRRRGLLGSMDGLIASTFGPSFTGQYLGAIMSGRPWTSTAVLKRHYNEAKGSWEDRLVYRNSPTEPAAPTANPDVFVPPTLGDGDILIPTTGDLGSPQPGNVAIPGIAGPIYVPRRLDERPEVVGADALYGPFAVPDGRVLAVDPWTGRIIQVRAAPGIRDGTADVVGMIVTPPFVSKAMAAFLGAFRNAAGRTRASDLIRWAEGQGWKRVQTPQGPIKFIDENGVVRVTIKRGSPRTPGSAMPHVELRDAGGRRVDPSGNPVPRRSPENHTPIDWDLDSP